MVDIGSISQYLAVHHFKVHRGHKAPSRGMGIQRGIISNQ